ncbi:hypothetical protein [Salinithrix halophila]|uniref:Uncharacterized protein n=1 Tax=Salinithrix halophila TaxID=1485204 RepID=A0ABV8JFQ4_9BACL
MFGFNRNRSKQHGQEQARGKTADDRKIEQMMNEVAGELGVDKDTRSLPREKAEDLGDRVKEEVKKRT